VRLPGFLRLLSNTQNPRRLSPGEVTSDWQSEQCQGRLRAATRINLQQEGFVLSPSVVALQVERVAAEVFAMKNGLRTRMMQEKLRAWKGYPAGH